MLTGQVPALPSAVLWEDADASRFVAEGAFGLVMDVTLELANRTRTSPELIQGVSTRGAQALHRACRARAFVQGRDFVVPDDVRALIVPAWAHRIAPRAGTSAEALLCDVLAGTPLPE